MPETPSEYCRRMDAVDRARTEVERRRRLRSMAERPTVVFMPGDREVIGWDDDAAADLTKAALGVLRGSPDGTKALDLHWPDVETAAPARHVPLGA